MPQSTGTARRRAAWPLVALLIIAFDMLGLSLYLGRRLFLVNPVWIYLALYAVLFLLYVYASGRILPRLPRALSRYTVPLILAFGVLFRLAVLPAPPSLSTDMYRYVWDGRLTLHGINPYRWTPNAQSLRWLRDSIWDRMEYKPYQTIYMPVSQGVFAVANRIFGNNLIGYKLIYVAFDCGVMALLLLLLRGLGRPPGQVIWYAWCPLPITEIALAGHQDVVGVFCLLLAFTLAMRPRTVLPAALALVAAALTKGFALLLLPLFCRAYGWRFTLVAACALIYLGMPLWVWLPEFLHGMKQYLDNVHVNGGLFHFLDMALAPLTRDHYEVAEKLGDAAILAVTVWAAWRPTAALPDLLRRSFIVIAVTLLVVPTLFPWYLVWLLPLVPLVGRRFAPAFVLLSGQFVWFYTYYIALHPYRWAPFVEYVPVYAVLAWQYWAWRRARGRPAQRDWTLLPARAEAPALAPSGGITKKSLEA